MRNDDFGNSAPRRKFLPALLAATAAFCFAACGPTVKNSAAPGRPVPTRLAFLPIKAPDGLRTERVSYIQAALRRELANGGVSLLNDEAVAKVCKSIACPERSELVSRYGADGFFELTIESASKNNALLGYVDQINGTSRVLDPSGAEIVSIEHRETETGGLLFNSGQVLEGIKSSVKNYGDDGFNFLAEKFAEKVGVKLAQVLDSDRSKAPPRSQERIDSATVKSVRTDTFKICLNGTPGGSASLNYGRHRFPLREVAPGSYCGTHWLDPASFGGGAEQPAFFGELRSSFGDVARRDVSIPLAPQCKWDDVFTLLSSEGGNEIRYAADSCPVDRYEVYRAPRPAGPYEKVAEVKRANWVDRLRRSGAGAMEAVRYQLIAISSDGRRSKPLTPRPAAGER